MRLLPNSVSFFKLCLIAAAPLLISACGEAGRRQCLGGTNACTFDTVTENQNSTTDSNTLGFTCSASAFPSRVQAGNNVRVQVDVYGTNETLSIPGYVSSFSKSVSVHGSYSASRAGSVVERTVEVYSSKYGSAYCSFRVEVLRDGEEDPNALSCNIAVQEATVTPGGTATLRFVATNAQGAVQFSDLKANSNWAVDNSSLQNIDSTTAGVAVKYTTEGPKQISVKVRDSKSEAFCSRTLRVGTPGIYLAASPALSAGLGGQILLEASLVGYTTQAPMTYTFTSSDTQAQITSTGSNSARIASSRGTEHSFALTVSASGTGVSATKTETLLFSNKVPAGPFVGCTVQTAPLAFPIEGSAASMAGSLTRIRTQAHGGAGPFTTTLLSVQGENNPVYDLYDGNPYANGQQLIARFRKPGTPRVMVQVRDSASGNTAICGTYHLSKPADLMITGADQAQAGPSVGPLVEVTRSQTKKSLERFHAFDSGFIGGVRVALGDFDGDGIADILAGRGYGSAGPGIRVFKGTDTLYYPGKVPPLMAQVASVYTAATPTRVYVAAGDVTADGRSEAIVGAGCDAASPRVRVYTKSGSAMALIADFQPYNGTGGAHVASADIDRDGFADIVVSPCVGTVVQVFSGKSLTWNWGSGNITATPLLLRQVNPVPGYQSEVKVAAGDIDGDGYADIITGYNGWVDAGGRTANSVRVYSGTTSALILNFDAFSYTNGAPRPDGIFKVAAADFTGDGIAEILVGGNFPNAQPEVRVFDTRNWTPFGYIYRFASVFPMIGSIYLGAGAGSM